MPEKKTNLIKEFVKKIRKILRGKLESEELVSKKRLEELRKKYEDQEKNPVYVTWEDFYYCTTGFQKDISAIQKDIATIKERTNIILCILIPIIAYLITII
ncbi:MAG: hypothetical protein ACXQTS_00410 [Candidatus Methanospirareceae archaeon]